MTVDVRSTIVVRGDRGGRGALKLRAGWFSVAGVFVAVSATTICAAPPAPGQELNTPARMLAGDPLVEYLLIDRTLRAELQRITRLDLGTREGRRWAEELGRPDGREGGPASVREQTSSPAAPPTRTRITVLTARGDERSADTSSLLALAPASWNAWRAVDSVGALAEATAAGGLLLAPMPRSWIELTDGQKLPGVLASRVVESAGGGGKSAGPDDAVVWTCDLFGDVTVALDDISRLVLDSSALAATGEVLAEEVASDIVLLTNGDRAEGFVEWIDGVGKAVVLAGTGGGGKSAKSRINLEQITEIRLANTVRPPRGARAWLTDGTVVGVRALSTDQAQGKLTITLDLGDGAERGGGGGSVGMGEVAALALDAGVLRPLSSLTVASFSPLSARRLAPPLLVGVGEPRSLEPPAIAGPEVRAEGDVDAAGAAASAARSVARGVWSVHPLGVRDILLPGPMRVEWALPVGARRVGTLAGLDAGCEDWGDCVVVLTVVPVGGAERELSRGRLNAARPVRELVGEFAPAKPGDRLRIDVESGEHGPIQDRVVLRQGLIVLDQ